MHDYYPAEGYASLPIAYDQERGVFTLATPTYPPGGTPARDPAPPALVPTRYRKHGDSMICLTCDMDVRYCRGHVAAQADDDRAVRDLDRRARECKGK